MVAVFQVVDNIGGGGVWLVVEEGGGSFYRNLVPEETRQLVVVGIAVEACPWQVEVTWCTKNLLGGR